MKRFLIVLGLLAAPVFAARAEDAPQPQRGCVVSSGILAAQGGGAATIECSGVGEQFAAQLADVLTEVLQRRLDPQQVMGKLADLKSVSDRPVERDLDAPHRQMIIQALYGKPTEQITIAADPREKDAGDYGKAIATALLMIGWQIEGNQILRKEVPGLNNVHGVVLVVRDAAAPPAKAEELKEALEKAQVEAPYHSDPAFTGDATVLWIGRRPSFNPLDQKS